MVGIELLRALAAHLDPGDEVAGLESRTLRFVIEYATEVNVATKVEEIRSAIGIDDFQFFPLLDGPSTDPEFGEFYVLQFPGLERTVDNRSLFSIAHELQSLLGAVTVEPDLGSDFYQEPVAPDAAPEGVLKDLFLGTCFVAGDPPADRHWALDRAGVLRAFDARPARGAGIRIAQPDTGVTQHTELADTTITDGFNVLTGASDPTDPLGRRQSWSRNRDRQRLGEWAERSGARFGAGGDPGADPLHRIGDPDLQRRRGRQGHRPRACVAATS